MEEEPKISFGSSPQTYRSIHLLFSLNDFFEWRTCFSITNFSKLAKTLNRDEHTVEMKRQAERLKMLIIHRN